MKTKVCTILGNGSIIIVRVWAICSIKMVAIIRANGIKISHMDMESIITLIKIGFLRESGELERNMELDNRHILMEQFIRETIVKISNKEMEYLYLALIA